MDALKSIVNHVPGWLSRLDKLSDQIADRQRELATEDDDFHNSLEPEPQDSQDPAPLSPRLTDPSPTQRKETRGNPEGAGGVDDTPTASNPITIAANDTTITVVATTATAVPQYPDPALPAQQAIPPPPQPTSPQVPLVEDLQLPTAGDVLTSSLAAAATTTAAAPAAAKNRRPAPVRCRTPAKRKQRPASVTSITPDGNPNSYRGRILVPVYYDGQVQTFFEDLVKFVSSSRNLMRRAKMAAKIAHIKRLAEMEFGPDEDDGADPITVRFTSMRHPSRLNRMSHRSDGQSRNPSSEGSANDMYSALDEHLDAVQSSSEKAAHQFLCNGECDEEIAAIQKRLESSHQMALTELDRVHAPDDGADRDPAHSDSHIARTLRVTSMRRDVRRDTATPAVKRSEIPLPASPPASAIAPAPPPAPTEATSKSSSSMDLVPDEAIGLD